MLFSNVVNYIENMAFSLLCTFDSHTDVRIIHDGCYKEGEEEREREREREKMSVYVRIFCTFIHGTKIHTHTKQLNVI